MSRNGSNPYLRKSSKIFNGCENLARKQTFLGKTDSAVANSLLIYQAEIKNFSENYMALIVLILAQSELGPRYS